jgi:hypothetical protein
MSVVIELSLLSSFNMHRVEYLPYDNPSPRLFDIQSRSGAIPERMNVGTKRSSQTCITSRWTFVFWVRTRQYRGYICVLQYI